MVINTPNYTHFEFALKAIQANKHVLVEKAFTVTSAEAKTLFEEAKKRNCYVMPYQNRRYDSDFLSVKQVLESGKLGKILEVHFRYDRYKYAISPNVSKEAPVLGSGLLYNLGSHLLDAAIALFGVPLSWEKATAKNRPNTQIVDYAHIHLKYSGGMQVFLTASLLVADASPAFILHGTNGSYLKERTDVQEAQLQAGMKPNDPLYGIEEANKEGILTTISGDFKNQEKIAPKKSSYINIFEAAFQTIRNNKPFPVTELQVIKQIEILED